MPNKTVKEIVKEYLKANGFDGLFNDEYSNDEGICSCPVDDLMLCGEGLGQCIAGHLVKIGDEEDIYYKKEEPEKEGQDGDNNNF